MSYGFSRAARRRRRRWFLLKWFLILIGILAAGTFSYWQGSILARYEVVNLRSSVTRLTDKLTQEEDKNAKLQSEVKEARAAETNWRQRYQSDVPTGKTKELVALMQAEIAKKVPRSRIAFMIKAAGVKNACEGAPVSKRFIVRTPLFTGANDAVNFADRTVTVSAQGEAAMDSLGNPEEWFDPAKPVTVWFVELGGKRTTKVEGKLPLFHSIVVNNVEHRFSIIKGERKGFISVTGDRCPLPKEAEQASK